MISASRYTYIDLGDDGGLGVVVETSRLLAPPIWAYSGGGASAISSSSKASDWNLCRARAMRTLPLLARFGGSFCTACSVYPGAGFATLLGSK